MSRSRKAGREGIRCVALGVASVAVMLAMLWSPVTAGGQAVPRATTTTGATSTTTRPRLPGCSELGAPCGSCGPVGQCLEHLDPRPPSRVCVDGGFCVQVGCSADSQCDAQQVCATLGNVPACCAPCP